MSDRCRDRQEVVRYWETIERFNPQRVTKTGPSVVDVHRDSPLPWDPEEVRRRGPPRKRTVWRHAVYVGVYPVGQVDELLDAVFGVGDGRRRRPRPTMSALAAFDVTADGVPVIGSIVISACAWAAGRLRRPGPGDPTWLRGFEDDAARLTSMATRQLLGSAAAELADAHSTRSLSFPRLEALRDELAARLGVAGMLACGQIRVKTMQVKRSRANRALARAPTISPWCVTSCRSPILTVTPLGHDWEREFVGVLGVRG